MGTLIIGIIAVFLYAKRQLAMKNPILNLRVFKHYNFTIGAILVMIDFGIILSAMYLLPQYLQNGIQAPVAMTGLIMLPGGIINAATSAIAGRMYDNFGAKLPARLGFIIALIGAVILSLGSNGVNTCR